MAAIQQLRTGSAFSSFLPRLSASMFSSSFRSTVLFTQQARQPPLLSLPNLAVAIPAALQSIPGLLGEIWDGILNAVPKKKTSHMKKRHRQMAGKALKDVTHLNKCPACGHTKKMHTLCPQCMGSKFATTSCCCLHESKSSPRFRNSKHVPKYEFSEEGLRYVRLDGVGTAAGTQSITSGKSWHGIGVRGRVVIPPIVYGLYKMYQPAYTKTLLCLRRSMAFVPTVLMGSICWLLPI